MPGAFENTESRASPALPVYETHVRDLVEDIGTGRRKVEKDIQRGDSRCVSSSFSVQLLLVCDTDRR